MYYIDGIFYELDSYQDLQSYLRSLSEGVYQELGWQVRGALCCIELIRSCYTIPSTVHKYYTTV